MGFLSQLTVLLAAASSVAAESVPANAAPQITSIKFSGNGCTKDPKFSGSFNNPTITFSDFSVSVPGDKTSNCQVHLQATGASPGWQVAIKKNVVKGYLVLSPGSSFTHFTTIFFSQDAANTVGLLYFILPQRGSQVTFTDKACPKQDTISDTVSNTGDKITHEDVTLYSHAGDKRVWSPCTNQDGYTGILNVNLRGALSGAGKSHFAAKTEEWELEWRRC